MKAMTERAEKRNESTYAAFAGVRRVAEGALAEVLPVLKARFDRDGSELILIFDDDTGRQVEFDLSGSLEQVLERALPATPRGPGRPKLGVTSREVSLLPRHWEFLEQQSTGISGALRRLLERAISHEPGREQARRTRAALSHFLSSMAGNRPNYEEATRALFNGELERFRELLQRWPKDVRQYALHRAERAERAERDLTGPSALVANLCDRVWSRGDYSAIEQLVAPEYVIHSDPGDPWEGQRLTHDQYRERVQYSRSAFPDLVFHLDEAIAAGARVATRWHAEGTHSGDLPELPATGKRLTFAGQTVYELSGARIAGHFQVVDRLGFYEQLRA